MPRATAAPERIYQLKVTLRGSKPAIWRRVEVADSVTLAKLHSILQTAMGWYDSHLHQFVVGDAYYGVPHPDMDVRDERRFKLNQALTAPKQKIVYEYDFGDSWEHEIVLEKVLAPEPGATYPRCTDGKRACPPEDCGGIWGYAELLEAISDPEHPEHEEMSEWLAEDFDPEAFDLDEVNVQLRRVR
jgi:hypothetical protein